MITLARTYLHAHAWYFPFAIHETVHDTNHVSYKHHIFQSNKNKYLCLLHPRHNIYIEPRSQYSMTMRNVIKQIPNIANKQSFYQQKIVYHESSKICTQRRDNDNKIAVASCAIWHISLRERCDVWNKVLLQIMSFLIMKKVSKPQHNSVFWHINHRKCIIMKNISMMGLYSNCHGFNAFAGSRVCWDDKSSKMFEKGRTKHSLPHFSGTSIKMQCIYD